MNDEKLRVIFPLWVIVDVNMLETESDGVTRRVWDGTGFWTEEIDGLSHLVMFTDVDIAEQFMKDHAVGEQCEAIPVKSLCELQRILQIVDSQEYSGVYVDPGLEPSQKSIRMIPELLQLLEHRK